MHTLKDNYNRYFSYLRISITDACNFQCKYCMPENYKFVDKNNLSLNEISNLIAAFSELGVNKIRITGGEPTLRKDFIDIAKVAASFNSIKSLVFTTNGYKLLELKNHIKSVGFTGVNISLDTLDKEKLLEARYQKYRSIGDFIEK